MNTQLGHTSPVAVFFFFAFVMVTLVITYWAARRTKTTSEFYAAGNSISGFQNGLALAGDYMSAASFLGITGLVATGGYDGLVYAVGYLVGWPIVMVVVAEQLRNLGKYTFADVVAFRLQPKPIRILGAIGSITTVLIYLIAQMVGAGALIKLMFNLPNELAIFLVGILMIAYVLFGGMLATTWVQIIKAVLLLCGASFLVFLVMAHFDWSFGTLFAQVAQLPNGSKLLAPQVTDAIAHSPLDLVSLGLGLMFGTAGLPHVLMRFYTVPDARAARKSVFVATGLVGYFYILTLIIGFGAATLVSSKALLPVAKGGYSSLMAAPLLAEQLGGPPLLGFLCAVAFATILAVVAGLTLAGASAISHDLYASVFRRGPANEGDEVRVAKAATVGLGILAILFGVAFKTVNSAFMVGLAFAVASSANFPALLLSVFWRRLTTAGAVASMVVGLFLSVVLIVFSSTVWTDVFHFAGDAPIPLKNPAIISMPASFLTAFVVSMLTSDPQAEAKFGEERVRAFLGVGFEQK